MNIAMEARIWAALDGCEGGDHLNGLAEIYDTAHYSIFEEETKQVLSDLMRKEINAMKEDALHPDAEFHGWDPVAVAEALSEIEIAHLQPDAEE